MNRPVDRLGQPLLVGDWVLTPSDVTAKWACGKFEVLDIIYDDGLCVVIDKMPDGRNVVAFCNTVTKINPKPETTTWDKCAWQPEGVKA